MHLGSVIFLVIFIQCKGVKVPIEVYQHRSSEYHLHHHRLNHNSGYHLRQKFFDINNLKVLYQIGNSDMDLPECSQGAVCNKIDLYDTPWIEKQCRCTENDCSNSLEVNDGYTLADKTRQYKLCEPVKKLPKCRYFTDMTWTLIIYQNNLTEQIVHCHCPRNSVTYLIKRQTDCKGNQVQYKYFFACSPQSRIRCQRKEPCRLFTVRKREKYVDEVNTNALCQCPVAHRCPRHHTDYGVIPGKIYTEEAIKTYSGYCLPKHKNDFYKV